MSDSLKAMSDAMAALVESAGRSIVRVEARRRHPASGIFYANDTIVTAHHVVERDDNIQVGLPDGSTLPATVAGRDPGTDIAVLRLQGAHALPPGSLATWVDAGDLRVGHLALALGRPGRTVQATLGIVSALGGPFRTGGGGEVDRYLQTDVVMYPGFSGGGLVEAGGRFAGMNTSALMRGVSVAIPAATVKRVVETLLAHGQMPRAYLGVGVQPVRLSDALAQAAGQETGLMVMSVEAGGPAAQGGLLQGDVIFALDGEAVRHLDDLQAALNADRAGRSVPVRIVRSGAVQEMAVTVGKK